MIIEKIEKKTMSPSYDYPLLLQHKSYGHVILVTSLDEKTSTYTGVCVASSAYCDLGLYSTAWGVKSFDFF